MSKEFMPDKFPPAILNDPKRTVVLDDNSVTFRDDDGKTEVWLSKEQAIQIAKAIIQRYETTV